MCYHRKSTFLKLSEKFHLVAFSVGAAVVKVFLHIAIIIVKNSWQHLAVDLFRCCSLFKSMCCVPPFQALQTRRRYYLSLLRLSDDDLSGLDGRGRLCAGLLGLLRALHLHSAGLLGQCEVVLHRLRWSHWLPHLLLMVRTGANRQTNTHTRRRAAISSLHLHELFLQV